MNTLIKIDGVDYSESIEIYEMTSKLDGGSTSSVFGSLEYEELEVNIFGNVDGSKIEVSFEYEDKVKPYDTFIISDVEYDDARDVTTIKAHTDLSELDVEFDMPDAKDTDELLTKLGLPKAPKNVPIVTTEDKYYPNKLKLIQDIAALTGSFVTTKGGLRFVTPTNTGVQKINWEDFELSGNKENLIKQGWDSFEPYGFGEYIGKAPEEVFEEGYVRNIFSYKNFKNVDYYDGIDVYRYKKLDNVGKDFFIKVSKKNPDEDIDNFWLTIGNHPNPNRTTNTSIFISNGDTLSHRNIKIDGDVYISYFPTTVDLSILDKYNIEIYATDKTSVEEQYVAWEDLSDEEKPVNAYEKGYTYIQPLDNGFTRVRTKGGDTDMKYKSPNFGQLGETGTDMTISLYVDNNSDSMIRFSNNLAIGGVSYPDGAEYMITVPSGYKGFAYLKGEKVDGTVEFDIRSDGDIDMIVSEPEIIMGHDLNAMLLVEKLEDGKSLVEVLNPNPDTKLTYKGGSGVSGEPYELKTKIDNLGRKLHMETNFGDREIGKGYKELSFEGNLDGSQFEIDIGALE